MLTGVERIHFEAPSKLLRFICVLLVFRPLMLLAASSVTTAVPLSYTQRLWQMQDGLPEQVVQAFAQNADRYLWIATTGGLVRFDGERFQTFNRDNTPAFTENNVFCLTVSRDHTLWIGMEGGGLIRYRDEAFRRFSAPEGLTNGFVRTLQEDRLGRFWVGTDNGLFRLENEHLHRVDANAQIPALAVHAIYEDHLGQIWVGGSSLFRINGESATEFVLPGEAGQHRVKSIAETDDGTIWVGTVSGLQQLALNDHSFKSVPGVREPSACFARLLMALSGLGRSAEACLLIVRDTFQELQFPIRCPAIQS